MVSDIISVKPVSNACFACTRFSTCHLSDEHFVHQLELPARVCISNAARDAYVRVNRLLGESLLTDSVVDPAKPSHFQSPCPHTFGRSGSTPSITRVSYLKRVADNIPNECGIRDVLYFKNHIKYMGKDLNFPGIVRPKYKPCMEISKETKVTSVRKR